MDNVYQQALLGTLKSSGKGKTKTATFVNMMTVPLYLNYISPTGAHTSIGNLMQTSGEMIVPGAKYPLSMIIEGDYYIATVAYSGAFAGVVQIPVNVANPTINLGCDLMPVPGDAGPVPVPGGTIAIPTDSPRVMVACGVLPNGNKITREQYWRRADDSFSLAPNEKRTIGFSTTSGLQQTSSEQKTLEESAGVSASAGWGPVSASVSASLSSSSTTFQQVTVSTETTRYESIELNNTTANPQTYFKWQLMDVITIFQNSPGVGVPLASMILGQQPVLVRGPY